jgi:hypothetical protein
VGKTRLLLEWCARHRGLYTVADQSSAPIQRRYFAEALSSRFRGFNEVTYPDWRALFGRLARDAKEAGWHGPLVIDELPALAASDAGFATVLQNWIDHAAKDAGLVVAVAGSSQRMMQGLVLKASAPLYGRSSVQIQLMPLKAGYLEEAFALKDSGQCIEAYSVWGGIPRYWELAAPFSSDLDQAVDECVLNPLGPLHDEPDRLLLEEIPPAQSVRPILDAIGAGCHRTSEIGARVGTPATSLARPLSRLVELGIVEREIPFGEPEKSGKRARYRISDPFFNFWFAVVAPHRGLLAEAKAAVRTSLWKRARTGLIAKTWESLCRQSVVSIEEGGPWLPARRYWWKDAPEWDVVSRSLDGKRILLGEVKWHSGAVPRERVEHTATELRRRKVPDVPECQDCERVYALFFPNVEGATKSILDVRIMDGAAVLANCR